MPDLPRFTGGAVGYFGYDATPWFEPALAPTWTRYAGAGDGIDDAGFMLFDTVLAFDHVKHRILVIANARITPHEDLEALYQFALARIGFVERELERGLSTAPANDGSPPEVRSNTSRPAYEAAVRAAKERIAAGDIYQVVLSQRFETDAPSDPFDGLSRAPLRQPVALHVFHPAR